MPTVTDSVTLVRPVLGIVRLAVAVLLLAAVIATHLDAASRGPVNVFNIYGYFTIQSNLLSAGALIALGITAVRGRVPGPVLTLVRAIATTCIVIVGIVYAVLLAPIAAEVGIDLPWANAVLHYVAPIVVALDWLLLGDRVVIPWRRIWWVLLYPFVWTVVVLIRGATDGWVPYPFLNPAQGYGIVSLYCVAILVVFVVVGLLVLLASRFRGVLLRR